MSFIEIDFGAKPPSVLFERGLRLVTLTGRRRLHVDCVFEPPCFCQAGIEDATLLGIGAFTLINGGVISHVRIGRYCSLAPDVRIGSVEHPTDWLTTSDVAQFSGVHEWDKFSAPDQVPALQQIRRGYKNSRPMTELGNDVWIGQGVFIKAGVKIGDGAIVGARSVVTKDVPPYAVVAGTPATLKKMRFPQATIDRLQALQWWKYKIFDFFSEPLDDIEFVLARLESLKVAGKLKNYEPVTLRTADLQSILTVPRELVTA
jgi:acetyltransferase-like isoleucine patch superfamily enzyme